MSRKALQSESPLNAENIGKIDQAIQELLTAHADAIAKAITESDDKQITVNFAVDINCAESNPIIDIKCRFTPCTITDKRTLQCEDPNQTTLNIYTEEDMERRHKAEKEAKDKADNAAAKAEKKAKKAADKAAKGGKGEDNGEDE